ncbi:MAG: hypothetical protein KKD38_07770 [Candidatus Delongbacteria bacterium]|nr:hypothetical protein [Candidatus Delongbacteria bacterium]MCG2761165.1 hypothetical protein [Candidatus Delongbacteria bacterium]
MKETVKMDILPTPLAVERTIELLYNKLKKNIILVNIGYSIVPFGPVKKSKPVKNAAMFGSARIRTGVIRPKIITNN